VQAIPAAVAPSDDVGESRGAAGLCACMQQHGAALDTVAAASLPTTSSLTLLAPVLVLCPAGAAAPAADKAVAPEAPAAPTGAVRRNPGTPTPPRPSTAPPSLGPFSRGLDAQAAATGTSCGTVPSVAGEAKQQQQVAALRPCCDNQPSLRERSRS
jgi:hypothetical protein